MFNILYSYNYVSYRPPFTIITFVRKHIFTGQEGTRWQYCAYVEAISGMPKSKDRENTDILSAR